jgi:hypothetical protein
MATADDPPQGERTPCSTNTPWTNCAACAWTAWSPRWPTRHQRAAAELPFEERLALLVQREIDWRDGKRVARLLKAARLKVSSACMEDIDWRASAAWTATSSPRWPAATGCATAATCSSPAPPAAARRGWVRAGAAGRAPGLHGALHPRHAAAAGAAGGPRRRQLQPPAGPAGALDLLVLDDLAIAPIAARAQDLLELLDDRVGSRSTLITSQLPVSAWHAWLDEPTIADAIMDRLLHGSHTLALKGESLRRAKAQA